MERPLDRRKMLALIAGGAATLAAAVTVDICSASDRAVQATGPVGAGTQPSVPAPVPSGTEAAPGVRGSGVLVVYFSRAGENYPSLDLDVGNTAQVAGFIHGRVGGDLFEIVPAEPYPESYDETTVQAQAELDEQVYPQIAGAVPGADRYGTVFLGYPIWWGEPPMVVQAFMRSRDLNGARLVPFVTHEGSGFGSSLEVLERAYPRAEQLEGFAARGVDVYEDSDRVRRDVGSWLAGLGF